jgi:SAM-dependent methyltransferase
MDKDILDKQCEHWDDRFSNFPDIFGKDESETARIAVDIFHREGVRKLLELGGGQGRDTIYFAQNDLSVNVLEYAENGVRIINENATEHSLADHIVALRHDLRKPLPFSDECFDGCYAHQVLCMALTTVELRFIFNEVRRILKADGIFLYTVRNTDDPHYRQGIHRGEDLYEMSGFIVHFFSKAKIEELANGFTIIAIERSEESRLPRRLFRVVMKKA